MQLNEKKIFLCEWMKIDTNVYFFLSLDALSRVEKSPSTTIRHRMYQIILFYIINI